VGASYASLTDVGKSATGGGGKGVGGKKQKGSMAAGASGAAFGSSTLVRQPSHVDLSKCFGKSSYFSDINPRSMKRLMNILAVTGAMHCENKCPYSCGYSVAGCFIPILQCWPRYHYSVNLRIQTYTVPVPIKYGKLATKYL